MKIRIAFIAAAVLIATLAVPASQTKALQSDPSIQPFWTKFKSAVTKGDKQAVAAMSQFPIEMPYGFPKIRTKAQLLKRYRELFNVQADAVKCFAGATPVVNEEDKNKFTVGCKDRAGNEVVVYGFAKTRESWKLISLDNINE